MQNFLQYILHGKSYISSDKKLNLQNFSQSLNDEFERNNQFSIPAQPKDTPGRLGGKNVVLDASTNVGIFMVEEDRLGVSSQANFSTVRANCCVFKGKWVYEVMLNTKGVMQLGWSTKNCHFSHEQGVGDTPDSFAYDGNRIRKWNVSTAKYGEAWRIGDTITCAIDLDLGTIIFYRNGKCLGDAFTNIKMGYGIAYFPTISLSIHESVRLNFGATPLLHPIEGFKPIQDAPVQDLVRAKILFAGLQRILDLFVRVDVIQLQINKPVSDSESHKDNSSNIINTNFTSNPTLYQSIAPYPLEKIDLTAAYHDESKLFARMDVDPDSPSSPPDRSFHLGNAKKPKIHDDSLQSSTLIKTTTDLPQDFACKTLNEFKITPSSCASSYFPEDFDVKQIPNFDSYLSSASASKKSLFSGGSGELSTNSSATAFGSASSEDLNEAPRMSPQALLFILSGYYLDRLAKVLNNSYVVEACFFKLLNKYRVPFDDDRAAEDHTCSYNAAFLNKFLDTFWAFTDDGQVKGVMECLITSIVTHYRFSPLDSDFKNQKTYLAFLKSLLRHEPTRKYLLQNILFEKIKLPLLLHLKSPDYTLLENLVPKPYLNVPSIFNPMTYEDPLINIPPAADSQSSASSLQEADDDRNGVKQSEVSLPGLNSIPSYSNSSTTSINPVKSIVENVPQNALDLFTCRNTKVSYENSMKNLSRLVSDIETMQQDVVKMLLNNRDTLKGVSSRYLFLKKFRSEFLRQNINLNIIHHPFSKCPLPAILCTFQHLCKYLRVEWDHYHEKYPHRSVPSSKAFVPAQYFYNDSINYFDLQRLAGLSSYLRRTYENELNEALNQSTSPIMTTSLSTTQGAAIPMFDSSISGLEASSSSAIPSTPTTSAPNSSSNMDVSTQAGPSALPSSSNVSTTTFSVNPKLKTEASSSSLIELLDGVILLYHISGHKHTSKMAKVRDILKEYLATIKSLQQKIDICPPEHTSVKMALLKTKEIFVNNALEQARLLSWIRTMVFSKEKQDNVAWVLRVIIASIDKAFSKGDNFHLFIPEFYLETCLNAFADLKNNFHPTAPLSDLQDFRSLLKSYVFLVVRCFVNDSSQIVNSDLRDRLTQSLADLVCYPASLKALENDLDVEYRLRLVEVLLRPYENRPWAQTNWILVRFWKGSGFGFKYASLPKCRKQGPPLESTPLPGLGGEENVSTRISSTDRISPNTMTTASEISNITTTISPPNNITTTNTIPTATSGLPPALQLTAQQVAINRPSLIPLLMNNSISFSSPSTTASINIVDYIKPMPSHIFQRHVGEVLNKDPEKASASVNSILNQLNWAFSEFVGMLQEIEQATSRTDVQVYVDARQLKLCATCFDLTVGLLRALEMIAFACHPVFTGFNERPAAEILLTNLLQLTCQILARVTSKKSAFNLVVSLSMPGLEMVQHYPILTAVAGILIQLIIKIDDNVSRSRSTQTLLNEAGFQLSNLQTLVGIDKPLNLYNTTTETPQETNVATTPQDKLVTQLLCLKNYDELNAEEIQNLDALVDWLEQEQAKATSARISISEEDLCPICYFRPLEVKFYPCGHKSCRSCITHYLMNKRECFFCKSNVGMIEDIVKTNSE